MYEYILANMQWIFSGIGATILTGLMTLFYRKRKSTSTKESEKISIEADVGSSVKAAIISGSGNTVDQSVNIVNNTLASTSYAIFDDYPDHPSVSDLLDQFKSLTPFQKIDNDKVINGVKIKTTVKFSGISKQELRADDIYRVIFETVNFNKSILLITSININDFPMFRSLPEGQLCLIAGVVRSISILATEIDLHLIKVFPPEKANDV